MMIRCLRVSVYRDADGTDCTNGGISSRFPALLVACPDGNLSFDASVETPLNLCMVQQRDIGTSRHARIVPAMVDDAGRIVPRGGYWWMFGGNVARTSDSRFTALAGMYCPLDIHDRRE